MISFVLAEVSVTRTLIQILTSACGSTMLSSLLCIASSVSLNTIIAVQFSHAVTARGNCAADSMSQYFCIHVQT